MNNMQNIQMQLYQLTNKIKELALLALHSQSNNKIENINLYERPCRTNEKDQVMNSLLISFL